MRGSSDVFNILLSSLRETGQDSIGTCFDDMDVWS